MTKRKMNMKSDDDKRIAELLIGLDNTEKQITSLDKRFSDMEEQSAIIDSYLDVVEQQINNMQASLNVLQKLAERAFPQEYAAYQKEGET